MKITEYRYILALVILIWISGCSEQGMKEIDSGNGASEAPRAVGKSEYGELQLMPKEKETIKKLGSPSCYGLEEDYSIFGNYKSQRRTIRAA